VEHQNPESENPGVPIAQVFLNNTMLQRWIVLLHEKLEFVEAEAKLKMETYYKVLQDGDEVLAKVKKDGDDALVEAKVKTERPKKIAKIANASLKNELHAVRTAHDEDIASKNNEVQNLRNKLAEKEQQHTVYITEIDLMEETHELLKSGLDVVKENLSKQFEVADIRIQDLRNQLEGKEAEIDRLNKAYQQLESGLEVLKDNRAKQIEAKQREIQDFHIAFAEKEQGLNTVIEGLRKASKDLQTVNASLVADNESLVKQIRDKDSEIQTLSVDYQEKERDYVVIIGGLDASHKRLESTNKELESDLATSKDDLTKQLANKDTEIHTLLSQIIVKIEECNTIHAANIDEIDKLRALHKREIATLKKAAQTARQELESALQSHATELSTKTTEFEKSISTLKPPLTTPPLDTDTFPDAQMHNQLSILTSHVAALDELTSSLDYLATEATARAEATDISTTIDDMKSEKEDAERKMEEAERERDGFRDALARKGEEFTVLQGRLRVEGAWW
jgi:chromosome segregation ATPase